MDQHFIPEQFACSLVGLGQRQPKPKHPKSSRIIQNQPILLQCFTIKKLSFNRGSKLTAAQLFEIFIRR
jgi:hypothetical protein